MNLLTEMSAQNGGEQSRLHQANEHLVNQSVSYESTHSRITDVDFSRESTALAKNQLRLQVLQGFIGQVNLGAQTALSLLH
jgi:flagellin